VTKIHEEWRTGNANELLAIFSDPQGEFVLIIPARTGDSVPSEPPQDSEIYRLFGQITETTALGRREAVRQVAETLNLAPKYVYDAIERAKISGD
jgi:16S rRNA C1402 (ribose-2'-O) methylase RsmI